MNRTIYLIIFSIMAVHTVFAQDMQDSTIHPDTLANRMNDLNRILNENENRRVVDSIKREELLQQMEMVRTYDKLKKKELEDRLDSLEISDSTRKAQLEAKIQDLKKKSKGYPVAPFQDTLFYIYTKIGPIKPEERAANIAKKINQLYNDDFLNIDSIQISPNETTMDIVYKDIILMSVTNWDAMWFNKSKDSLVHDYLKAIKAAIKKEVEQNSIIKVLERIGLALLIIFIIWLLIYGINRVFGKAERWLTVNSDKYMTGIKIRSYTFLAPENELNWILKVLTLIKWFFVLVLLYLTLPLVFSIFPITRGWAQDLFHLVLDPLRKIIKSGTDYFPNLVTIIVIYIITRYIVKFFKYLSKEIESENLKLPNFHADWAKPTYSILKFLLYAFMFVVIFPYLPGSDSPIFKGVSVFLGILFSLGSSSAISNIVAGMVITYMRPFKIGDRIKMGEIVGDVVEKNLLVTRIKTIKNEEITIPNSTILSNHTVNYTSSSGEQGLILYSTVTIGYDVPWKKIHDALITAALKTDMILKEPRPFVLQTSLDDFYVSYQINAYTREAGKQAIIYSELHKNIQDTCLEFGIEIMSPHYRAVRDGNIVAIPPEAIPKDYKVPSFRIDTDVNRND